MRLLLVRHGQTSSSVARLLDTAAPGADLTDEGRQQAEALVPTLTPLDLQGLYVSDLVRTHQTAAPLAAARGLTPVIRPGLREIQAGDDEMTGDPERWEAYLLVVCRWLDGDLDARMPGGESGVEVLARYDAAIAEIASTHPGGTAVAVSHGAVVRAWCGMRASNLDRDFVASSRLGNTAVVVLEGSPDQGWRVVTWAEAEPPGV